MKAQHQTITYGDNTITIFKEAGKYSYECSCGEESKEDGVRDEIMLDALKHTCKES